MEIDSVKRMIIGLAMKVYSRKIKWSWGGMGICPGTGPGMIGAGHMSMPNVGDDDCDAGRRGNGSDDDEAGCGERDGKRGRDCDAADGIEGGARDKTGELCSHARALWAGIQGAFDDEKE